uniref:Apolipoprotein A-IV n=1 Tax=Pseudonaja textilis TaxID=8673 RepID=A0A670Y4F6_PSETE
RPLPFVGFCVLLVITSFSSPLTRLLLSCRVNIGQKLEALAIVVREIKEQVTPELQELRTELQTAWQTLKEELTKDVHEVGAQIQPLVRKLRENVQQDASAYFQQLRTISQDINQVAQEKLRPIAEDFRDKVRSHVDEFRKDLVPYVEQLQATTDTLELQAQVKENVGDPAALSPYLQRLQQTVNQQVEDIKVQLGPFPAELKVLLILQLHRAARPTQKGLGGTP